MRIKKIELFNFGSYEGHNRFDFESKNDNERVIVIGGKNGAGKTTLFTAVQVCLYGHYAFGYKSPGKFYLKELYNLINNKVRLDDSKTAYLEITFQQIDSVDEYEYTIRREWCWPENEIVESIVVYQNGKLLCEDELGNFQNYLLHLIPPDMLKLYFFDGEKIANYFLDHKEVNIRDALMVLSGNDTFDILYENVKRVIKGIESTDHTPAEEYLNAVKEVNDLSSEIKSLEAQLANYQNEKDQLLSDIEKLKVDYASKGGISLDQWKKLHSQLKTEEDLREHLNWKRKELATDILPFLIVPELLEKVLPQIEDERNYHSYLSLKDTLEHKNFVMLLENAVKKINSINPKHDSQILYNEIQEYLLNDQWECFSPILVLSADEERNVQSVCYKVSSCDPAIFKDLRTQLDSSIEKSKELRIKIQNSEIENFEAHFSTLTSLNEQVGFITIKINQLLSEIESQKDLLNEKEVKLKGQKKHFEEFLRSESVASVAGRVLLLLSDLQNTMYSALVHKVEQDLNEKFGELIRKKNFFTRIVIDPDFNVHILRNQPVSKEDLLSLLRNSLTMAKKALGVAAVEQLQVLLKTQSASEMRVALEYRAETEIVLPVEIDKDQFSSGEKQIFVMSLYWAMMNQSKNDLPFIIDTPFARIDTEHRANITNQFFKKLSGQLIVLSTDEELSNKHLDEMQDQISNVYILEYGDDKRTHIKKDQYFEV